MISLQNKPVFFKAFLLLPLSLLALLTRPQLLFTLGRGEGGGDSSRTTVIPRSAAHGRHCHTPSSGTPLLVTELSRGKS